MNLMARVAGFEPTHQGVKVPCLTAWLHPYIVYFAPESRFSTEDIQLISETDRTWLILFIVLLPLRSTRKEKLFMSLWEKQTSLWSERGESNPYLRNRRPPFSTVKLLPHFRFLFVSYLNWCTKYITVSFFCQEFLEIFLKTFFYFRNNIVNHFFFCFAQDPCFFFFIFLLLQKLKKIITININVFFSYRHIYLI